MSDVSKVYRSGAHQTSVLEGLYLRVNHGDFLTVTGPPGPCKASLMNIAGLLEPCSGGDVVLDGIDVGPLNDAALARLRNEKLGFIFDGCGLIADLSVFDNVELTLRYRGMAAAERTVHVDAALRTVGMATRARAYPAHLAGCEPHRVAIARAIVGAPRMLLVDEPTRHLDVSRARGIMTLLEAINAQGTTIMLASADPELALRAQRNVRIVNGRAIDIVRSAR